MKCLQGLVDIKLKRLRFLQLMKILFNGELRYFRKVVNMGLQLVKKAYKEERYQNALSKLDKVESFIDNFKFLSGSKFSKSWEDVLLID